MHEAYRLTRKDGAPGIDGVKADDYAKNLDANLLDLLDRIKLGRYQAPPVRRTYIPKADGSRRPLGIPTFEDKVAQRAIVMVLEAVFEQDFLPCSFGFRPGRSAHQALQYLRAGFMSQRLRWVIDIDIEKYFDSIPHSGLTLHPDKTRFVDFRNTASNGMADPATDGTTFTFLGFTYIWGKSRAGKNVVRLVTAKNRYSRALAAPADP